MVIAHLNILDFRLFDAWKSQTIFSQMVVSLIVIYHGRIHKTSPSKQTKDISFNLPPKIQDAGSSQMTGSFVGIPKNLKMFHSSSLGGDEESASWVLNV